jgi:hypothetical protein
MVIGNSPVVSEHMNLLIDKALNGIDSESISTKSVFLNQNQTLLFQSGGCAKESNCFQMANWFS